MITKRCRVCGRRKKAESFYTHPSMRDGRLNKCKKCCTKYNQAIRSKFPERYRLINWLSMRKPATRARRNAWFAAKRKAKT